MSISPSSLLENPSAQLRGGLKKLLVRLPVVGVAGGVDEEVDAVLDPIDHKDGDAEGHIRTVLLRQERDDVVNADGDNAHQEEEQEGQKKGRRLHHVPKPLLHQFLRPAKWKSKTLSLKDVH